MNFIGEKCVYCNEVFSESDDVVVCPECGSPHHRECYKKDGRCANSSMHKEGIKWQRENDTVKAKTDEKIARIVICAKCGHPNSENSEKCVMCGTTLENSKVIETDHVVINDDDMRGEYSTGFNPEEDMGGATLKEVSMFVGTNTFYYIPIFKKMKDIGSKISFNLSCFMFPSFYFANRRMWFWAMISALIGVILELPTSILFMAKENVFTDRMLNIIYDNQGFIENLQDLCGWGSWIFRLVLCLFANRIYFNFVMKSLKRIRLHSRGEGINLDIVTALGGVKPFNIIIITLITLSLILVSMVGITMFLSVMTVI